eukprot:CAMPEP_0197601192 /NCGR_PEP_ID=MMETSP1326-20131121/34825_1 /TAXON_ID=1155430 /ORGANISM="Genus nov. species nov., Strain RCC2288" /LENGTH=87 /DNA_ID=CAMNT_0043168385 /DNA_START=645 /DNA_END=905 /DNA_ORIENTATION=-
MISTALSRRALYRASPLGFPLLFAPSAAEDLLLSMSCSVEGGGGPQQPPAAGAAAAAASGLGGGGIPAPEREGLGAQDIRGGGAFLC